MRKLASLSILALFAGILACPLYAAGRHQSYFTYDDGGTTIKAADDGHEIDVRVNQPVFPGDEVTTSRRGRSEIRMSDGNVIGLDRSTSVRFRSILDSYEGESDKTIVELRFGHVMIQRTASGSQALRIDTNSASYLASGEAIYSVDNDGRGRERVTVLDGAVEVRTPQRSTRLREGEEAHVDEQGVFGTVSQARTVADDFERWFLHRADRHTRSSSRYLDRSLAYSDYDLEENGSWLYASSYGGWCWRPRVEVGWRPYFYGSWASSRVGSLTWVSSEPWGWVPYHYGRWAYESVYGWVWLPGPAYAPAWVYWMYGPSYIGWAPMGWYDCYRPYYDWAYRPYARGGYASGFEFGFGFYGRVRVNEVDLRPWTFVDANTIVSTRTDRAALTTDIIRQRLARDGGGFATVSGTPARLTRSELRDPAATIARRGLAGGGGAAGTGSTTDMTPFFRRDPELPAAVRDRVVRNRPSDSSRPVFPGSGGSGAVSTLAPVGRAGLAPGGGSSSAPIGGGSISSVEDGRMGRRGDRSAGGMTRGGDAPGSGSTIDRGSGRINQPDRGVNRVGDTPSSTVPVERSSGRINRGDQPGHGVNREGSGGGDISSTPGAGWRERIERPAAGTPQGRQPSIEPAPDRAAGVDRSSERSRDGSWRARGVSPQPGESSSVPSAEPRPRGGSDVPRRVIDSIGGARVYRGEGSGGASNRGQDSNRGGDGDSSRSSEPAPHVERSSPPPPPRQEAPPSRPDRSEHIEREHR